MKYNPEDGWALMGLIESHPSEYAVVTDDKMPIARILKEKGYVSFQFDDKAHLWRARLTAKGHKRLAQ